MKKIDPAKWLIYQLIMPESIGEFSAIFITTNAKIAKNMKTGACSI